MPELPEMETYRTLLAPRMVGRTVTGAEAGRVKSVGMESSELFVESVAGRRILRIDRRGKHLIFTLDGSGSRYLLLHLMLDGWMFFGSETQKPDRTVQVRLTFDDMDEHLYFIGLRLGYLFLVNDVELERRVGKLGPEPLPPAFGQFQLAAALRTRKRALLKPVLTDQSVIAGIGNCYADEMCFRAGIRPDTPISELADSDMNMLYRAMQETFREAIAFGGYMEHPLFVGDGLTGGYNDRCLVYDRGGAPCARCGAAIVQDELNSRKVFYCPHYQPSAKPVALGSR